MDIFLELLAVFILIYTIIVLLYLIIVSIYKRIKKNPNNNKKIKTIIINIILPSPDEEHSNQK